MLLCVASRSTAHLHMAALPANGVHAARRRGTTRRSVAGLPPLHYDRMAASVRAPPPFKESLPCRTGLLGHAGLYCFQHAVCVSRTWDLGQVCCIICDQECSCIQQPCSSALTLQLTWHIHT